MCLPATVYKFSSWQNWMTVPKATAPHFFKIRFNNIPQSMCLPTTVYKFRSWQNWMPVPKATSPHFFKIRLNNIPPIYMFTNNCL